MKVLVFDMGGTLINFKDMPYSWVDYYKIGFEKIAQDCNYIVSEKQLKKSIDIMKSFNPRVVYRETEYTPEHIFKSALQDWNINIDIDKAIYSFFNGLNLTAQIYEDTILNLKKLKSMGYTIAAYTDLPTAMPDDLFKQSITDLLTHIDYYVSSQSCGYRKPNKYGLEQIAKNYQVPIEALIFVGDEEKDRKAAENANCKFIQIDRTKMNLKANITTLEDIFDYLGD